MDKTSVELEKRMRSSKTQMLNLKNECQTLNKLRPKRTNVQHEQNEC